MRKARTVRNAREFRFTRILCREKSNASGQKGIMKSPVLFDSRDPRFRMPVGAVPSGTKVWFRVLVDEALEPSCGKLIVEFDRNHSTADYPMENIGRSADGYYRFQTAVTIQDTGLYWYSFVFRTKEDWISVGRSAERNRAEIQVSPEAWQQTVYRRKYPAPSWLEGGVIYHIFVDRFAHSGPYVRENGKVTREDWGGMPGYRPDSSGRILNNDFFGGNLQGIIEKLPYLQDLGVTCLYLSPIFEAYSNHKYDTADYMRVDPMFGTEKDLKQLCREAGKRGIRIMLDGVFSHTGSDSKYFDRYGTYGGTDGAYGHPDSPYRSWYYFHQYEQYETWWGIDTLPRINKENQDYISFICGPDGVARHWLRDGVSGWRLDVADELPNSFLKKLAEAVKTEKPDALLMGEVWEDASSKIAYSERKNYFEGDKLDSVMNYPFRTGIIDFLLSGDARKLAEMVETIGEHYPPEVMNCVMNILGTHDTERILTVLGGKDLGENPTRQQQAAEVMTPEERRTGVKRLKAAVLLQMTLPGVPCVYYGDEAGLEGYRDPFNRKCFPWGEEDAEIESWYREIIRIRRSMPVYRTGKYATLQTDGGLYAFVRWDGNDQAVTAVNAGSVEESLLVPGIWTDLLTGASFQDDVLMAPGDLRLLTRRTAPEQKKEGEDMSYRENYEKWLGSPAVDERTKKELEALSSDEKEIEERFTAMLSFGTAGLRGIMRAGLNGMNVYTVRYATQGLANLILSCGEDVGGGVTIAYDSRNNSPLFASEAAGVLAANGIHVNLFDELRPTPELSFALRETGSIAGINITASHNTKEYNGYKVYWSDGAQLPPEHAAEVSAQMEKLDIFDDVKTMDPEDGKAQGLITMLDRSMDEKYLEKVLEQKVGDRYVKEAAEDLTIIYTPFHGSGYRLVPEVLRRLGMKHVLTVQEQMVIDGNFPTVKSPNPEFVEGFAIAIDMARANNVDLIIGTDPDGDRCGIVVRNGEEYQSLSGNQLGVLLLDYLIRARRENGTLPENAAAVKSIVSTTMANRVAADNGVKLFETLTGFKYIGEKIKEFLASGDYSFLFGFEESNGYLAGTYARDKDAVVASMLTAEMACYYHTKGMNLYEALQALYEQYGWFREKVVSHTVEGFDGPEKMAKMMSDLRLDPPKTFGGLKVLRVRDYQSGEIRDLTDGSTEPTGLPSSNVLFYELEEQCAAVIRPSGTEPKVKLYVMVRGENREDAEARLEAVTADGTALLGQ